jgi:hypothetical protein
VVYRPFIMCSADGNPITRMGVTPFGLAAGIESDRSHELLKVPSRMILRVELIAEAWRALRNARSRRILEPKTIADKPRSEEKLAAVLKRTVPIHACFKSITADAFCFTSESSDCQSATAARDRSIVWRTSDRTSTTAGPFADIASATTSAACAAFVIV